MFKPAKRQKWLFGLLSLCFFAITGNIAKIYQTSTPPDGHGTLKSVDLWVAPDPDSSLIFISDLSSNFLEIHNATTNTFIEQLNNSGTGQLSAPTGVAVAYNVETSSGTTDIVLVAERDNNQISAYSLPERTFIGAFGSAILNQPNDLTVYYEGDKIQAWIINRGAAPKQVVVYDLLPGGDGIRGSFHRTFEVQGTPEFIEIDAYFQEIYLTDSGIDKNILIYDLTGNYKGRFGQGQFSGGPQGICLYDMGAGSGWILVSDKDASQIEVFERKTYSFIGNFTSDASLSSGIAITQRAIPNLLNGSFFAVNAGENVQAYNWTDISSTLSLGTRIIEAPLIAPTDLKITQSTPSSVNLTWVDRSDNESNYRVERKIDNGNYSELVSLTANTEQFTDIFTSASTKYSYRVLAHNNTAESAYSNEISVTTPAAGSNAPPIAILESTQTAARTGVEIQFTGSNSTDPNSNISSYHWIFGDGHTASSADTNHIFTSEGIFEVKLTVSDELGLQDIATVSIQITDNSPPVASISQPADGTNFISGSIISFVGSGSDLEDGSIPAANFTWLIDMPNGLKNFIIAQGTKSGTGNAPMDGNYLLKLAIEDSEGLPDTAFVNFSVGPRPNIQPSVIAEADVTSGDTPLFVQFTGSNSSDSDGTISSYSWDFGDGFTSSAADPLHEFQNDGLFNVRLIATDNGGLTDTAFVLITVNPTSNIRPTAIAEADITTGDAPLTVQFTGSNSSDFDGTISLYLWNFGDGGTSTSADPQHIFTTDGAYKVQLIVADNGGLKDTSEVLINVGNPPVGGVVVGTIDGFNTPNQSKLFYHGGHWWLTAAAQDNGHWYLWKYTDGSWEKNIEIIDSNDSRPDALVDSNNNKCYILFSRKSSTRFTRLTFAAGAWSVDTGFPVTLLDFNHQDDGAISMTMDKAGELWLFRIFNQNLEGKHSKDGGKTWSATLFIKTGLNQPIGLTDATTFRNGTKNSIGLVYGENASSGSVFGFLYHEDGTANTNWVDETSRLGMWPNVHADDHVAITSDGGGRLFVITKTGSPGGNSVKNGLFKRDANGWHKYGVNITLSWARPAIAFDKTNNDLFVFGTRESLPKVCEYKKVKAGNEELLIDKPIHTLFENGSDHFDNISVAQHAGSAETGLFAAAENTAQNQIWAKKIIIDADPANEAPTAIATATPLSGNVPLTVNFSGSQSTDPDNNIAIYAWNFGDGTSSSSAEVPHTYTTAGTFDVRLIVKDIGALADTATLQIIVKSITNERPNAIAEADIFSGNVPLTVNFNGSNSNDTDGVVSAFAWNFADGIASTEPSPQHTFISAGTYEVRLIVTDNSGLTDTAFVSISVSARPNRPPIASIILPVANTIFNISEAINYSGTGRDPEDGGLPVANFTWYFSSHGEESSLLASGIKTGSVHPDKAGVFNLFLVVQDSKGLKDTASVQYSVSGSTGLGEWRQTSSEIPEKFVLSDAYPNPFSRHAAKHGIKVSIGVPKTAPVSFHIYNTLGQKIATLLQENILHAGYHTVSWNGKNNFGREVPNGLYFFKIQAGAEQQNMKISIVR